MLVYLYNGYFKGMFKVVFCVNKFVVIFFIIYDKEIDKVVFIGKSY